MPLCEQDSGFGDSHSNNSKERKLISKSRHASSSLSTSSDESTWSGSSLSLPSPPDGGYGWVIVLASFFVNFIADGCAYSYGVIYVELLRYFDESRSRTALVGAIFISVPLITGPVASALTNKYGCRKVTMAGGLIAGIGFIASSFVRDINLLCFTFGIIAGFGLALVYVPSLIIVAFYFEKRRAFATGLAVAGNGIGTFILSPLIECLIEEYAWHGTFLILGSFMLNIVVCGALFRPLIPQKVLWARHKQKSKERFSSRTSTESVNESPIHNSDDKKRALLQREPEEDLHVTYSLVQLPTYLQNKVHSPELIKQFLQNYKNNRTHFAVGSDRNVAVSSDMSPSDQCLPAKKKIQGKVVQLPDQYPMYRQDIFYRGSLLRTAPSSNRFPVRATSCPDVFLMSQSKPIAHEEREGCSALCTGGAAKKMLHTMLDLSIFKSVIFKYFCVHSLMLSLTYDIPYMYMVDRAIPLGIPEVRSSFLVSIIGITSTIGQIFAGLMGDQPRVNSLVFYNIMTAFAGACTMAVPFLLTFEALATYSALYGFFISANYAMTTIILVELLDMERLTNAFGMVSLAEGLANLVGPPLAGYLTDLTGSFDTTFFIFGGIMFLSGIMLFAIPCLKPYDRLQKSAVLAVSSSEDEEEEEEKMGGGGRHLQKTTLVESTNLKTESSLV
ncbi:hypothetical protein CAPTEDRAFT_225236 [Capitella teleta]|uniref:Major facilitator superfamily (MFS) profile domain-containing protein n=1 Tax=Capitella teleta TaxID=283909 RepID=R7TUP6_CAPTE|nr:hypothetical protein CAPTEDRAFT_225236 [Capitella teleta]|eukprot:ELT97404.1 hypothetical protein CAPTEDRAFT_225236 [Capitella teleta]